MDVELFWNNITFSPLYKEKGMWVMGALVDCGMITQLLVVTENKADKLTNMNWKLIYGIEPNGQIKKTQYFEPPIVIDNVLVAKGRYFKETKYMHKHEPYFVIKKHDDRIYNTEQCPDTCKIQEMFCQPNFVIKRTG